MAFIDRILQEPSYGWADKEGNLIIPTKRQLFKEAFSRVNIFKSKKNWLGFFGWFVILCLMPFFVSFFAFYFSWPMLGVMFVYMMILLGTHGTIWLHRFGTHKAYKFSSPIWRFVTQNLVIKVIQEEMYIVSHHVHHAKSDLPGDPYNARAGLWYCLLADVNHQGVSKNLTESEYNKATRYLKHTGVGINSYKAYQKWGTITSPYYAVAIWLLNWAFWGTILFLIGGPSLVCAMFSAAMIWLIGVRAFNYTGHGKGKEKHIDGVDYDRSNLAINQTRPGLFTGEWHNNHHLYPASARAGFLPYQIDLAWIYIYCLYKMKMVSSYHDYKPEFMRKYRAEQALSKAENAALEKRSIPQQQ